MYRREGVGTQFPARRVCIPLISHGIHVGGGQQRYYGPSRMSPTRISKALSSDD